MFEIYILSLFNIEENISCRIVYIYIWILARALFFNKEKLYRKQRLKETKDRQKDKQSKRRGQNS